MSKQDRAEKTEKEKPAAAAAAAAPKKPASLSPDEEKKVAARIEKFHRATGWSSSRTNEVAQLFAAKDFDAIKAIAKKIEESTDPLDAPFRETVVAELLALAAGE